MSKADRRKAADLDVGNFHGQMVEMRQSLDRESERGCVVVASAFLEEALEALLRARLVDDELDPKEKRLESLFDHPLGTFDAKTRLAFAVGLIGRNERDDADVIRKLRNDFAHLHLAVSFADQHVKDECKKLKVLADLDRSVIEAEPRWAFTLSVSLLAFNWHGRLMPAFVQRLEQAKDRIWTREQIDLFDRDPPSERDELQGRS